METSCNRNVTMQGNCRNYGNQNYNYGVNVAMNGNGRNMSSNYSRCDGHTHSYTSLNQGVDKGCHNVESRSGAETKVEVDCVCKVNSNQICHKHDKMEKLGYEFPIAMAYVPWQQWGELYDAEYGLKKGTIFKDLNKIFCGERC